MYMHKDNIIQYIITSINAIYIYIYIYIYINISCILEYCSIRILNFDYTNTNFITQKKCNICIR